MTVNKKKIAISLMSKKEKEEGKQPFLSRAWETRKQAIADRVKRKQDAAHARAIIRKETAKPKSRTKKEVKAAEELLKKIEKKKSKNLKFIDKISKKLYA